MIGSVLGAAKPAIYFWLSGVNVDNQKHGYNTIDRLR